MIVEQAHAKLNLALHVRGRRPDGYHELETLFAFVAAGDELHVGGADGWRIDVAGPFASALAGEGDNLVLRAARAFESAFGVQPPAAFALTKRLPVASGIGGGSADAAAALRALGRRAGGVDQDALMEVAAALGSDVPACLLGTTAIGRGRGEQLVPVASLVGTPVLLVNPGVAVGTRDVFARWSGEDRGPLPDGDAATIMHGGRNDLEAPARQTAPVIGEVLDRLRDTPATLVRMSGSGATCFGLFADTDARAAAACALAAARPGWWVCESELL